MEADKIVFEYWDAELKTQSKTLLLMLNKALAETGATVISKKECILFEGRLKWRNPLLLKVKLLKGRRWAFILASNCKIWLHEPPRVQMGTQYIGGFYGTKYLAPPIACRGEHNELTLPLRRVYRLHPHHAAYISDYRPDLNGDSAYFEGADMVSGVLEGNLDLLKAPPPRDTETP